LCESSLGAFKIAVAQFDPQIGNIEHNRERIAHFLGEAARAGAKLVVFPECALSGYVFGSAEEAFPSTETVPGETTAMICELCRRYEVYAIVGLLERDGKNIYNSAFVAGPHGLVTNYRKCHLPILGIDRFVAKGNEIPVIDLPFARIGVLICYDLRFPEAARSLALRGIDILILPTNWPQGAESSPEFLTRARSWENKIFVAACNRVGEERGTTFIGRSQIVGSDSKFLATADGESEMVIYAEIDPALAREKRIVIKPGEFEFDPIGHRRPELYGQ
jgi:predicted amidohydrolase